MKVIKTGFPEVLEILPTVYKDNRGYFFESYNKKIFRENGINCELLQFMHSQSIKNTIRGLHYQVYPNPQAKIVYVIDGKIMDVIVDIRHGSPKFGEHIKIEISSRKKNQVYIPIGFAHGFSVLSKSATVAYMVSGEYSKDDERGIMYNDRTLNIKWNIKNPILSKKDLNNMLFESINKDFDY